ncbi:nucleoside-diphosphate sugar epimerase/dehydratase [Ornithinimicrobium humiphilum]|uniref:FlaA1/EpsC-like NDP-sugar epimerase n=1 Tax=Ornithinimicrobium humiphilum TaxID=125288 RepID=A0A543K8A1_9MICO|nr:nucleoside-diphosphate sugar epimerase/dehydratase [Ornithinimicrobium humiphilum]TQM91263.1 FlaA1/EpsC-like NDP-sugar epimerase [Ornithinimicrobium humiphilum]
MPQNGLDPSTPVSESKFGRRSPAREAVVRGLWIATDSACWAVAVLVSLFTRLAVNPDLFAQANAWLSALIAAALHAAVGILTGPYMVRHMRGSFDEVTSVVKTAVIAGALFVAVAWATPADMLLPRSVAVLAPALAIVLMLAVRFTVRTYRAQRMAKNPSGEKVIVLGAGLAGRRLVHNMLHDDQAQFTPVALLDDDRSKRRLKIEGVRVMGTRRDLASIAEATKARYVAVAIPRAKPELLREIQQQARNLGLQIKMLPPIEEWMRQSDPSSTDLRDLNLEDLLGRRAVQLDQHAISEHITGKVVLVTGAGGSIGSELCRQISAFHPARLVMLDRDESALHAAQLSLTGRALLHGEDLLLADIRNDDTLLEHFTEIKPDVVFHAAALKHLSLLERYPAEAWKTNVLGTLNVLDAAARAGVGTFVNISTDKAASPTSVLGYSKRVAERLTAHYAATQPGRYVSVRFGNVLGSRGSVIPAFTEQIRQGGPVTVTHPDVERYFMLIPEACQLVLQAGAIGRDGQVMVLDMGTPVKIVDVARELIALSGKQIEIQFTGLRPGEKLTEVLFTDGENHLETGHPLMTAVAVPATNPGHLPALHQARSAEVTHALRAHCLTS